MFCTVCATVNPREATACASCGAGLGGAASAARRGVSGRVRRALLLALQILPVLALASVLGLALARDRADTARAADAYLRGERALAAGDPEAAMIAFAAAGGHRDARDRAAEAEAALAPSRTAYEAGLAALDGGRFRQAIDLLLPVAAASPGLDDVTERLADARRLEADRLRREADAAESRRDWLTAGRRLRELGALDPADPAVPARIAALDREHGPLVLSRERTVWLAAPDGLDAAPLVEGHEAMWPTWSPDRSRIAFFEIDMTDPASQVSLLVADVETGAVERLAGAASAHTAPAWSPDGERIAFTSFQAYDPILDDGPIAVHVVDMASGAETDVTGSGFGLAFNPAFSPDGKSLAFVSKERATNQRPQHARGDVFVTEPGSGTFENLTGGRVLDAWSVHWSPAGDELLVYSLYGQSWYEPPQTTIRALSLAGGELSDVTSAAQEVGPPVWSPDGSRFAYVEGDLDIHVLHGGEDLRIPVNQPLSNEISWSPDGSAFIAASISGVTPSILVELDGDAAVPRETAIQYDAEPPFYGPPQWGPLQGAPADDPGLDGTGLDTTR